MAAVAAVDVAAEATAATTVAAVTEAAAATKGVGATEGAAVTAVAVINSLRRVLMFFSNNLISYAASYTGPIQTGFLRGFQKRYGGTGIVIPVKKVPQERKTQESRGFLQE